MENLSNIGCIASMRFFQLTILSNTRARIPESEGKLLDTITARRAYARAESTQRSLVKKQSYPCAVTAMTEDGNRWQRARLCQVKYDVNNIVEGDHHRAKRLL
jgi:transposase-like protein